MHYDQALKTMRRALGPDADKDPKRMESVTAVLRWMQAWRSDARVEHLPGADYHTSLHEFARIRASLEAALHGDAPGPDSHLRNAAERMQRHERLFRALERMRRTFPKPRLAEGETFLAAVLSDEEFRQKGILFGREPAHRGQWVVLDPNRHEMRTWKKPSQTDDCRVYAKSLQASVYTNGPFWKAADGSLAGNAAMIRLKGYAADFRALHEQMPALYTTGGLVAATEVFGLAVVDVVNYGYRKAFQSKSDPLPRPDTGAEQEWDRLAGQVAPTRPCGTVFGAWGSEPGYVPFVQNHYFGRTAGKGFSSYKIGPGSPAGCVEAVAGLPAVVAGGKAQAAVPGMTDDSNTYFIWGLAPLQASDPDQRSARAYYSEAGHAAPDGLIVGLYVHHPPPKQALLAAGITDAVALDKSDSVMFGRGGEAIIGDSMRPEKVNGNNWGIAFFACE